jgi:hypothetical protein
MRSARYLSLVLLLSLSMSLPAAASPRERDGQREGRFDRVVRIVKHFLGMGNGDTLIVPIP